MHPAFDKSTSCEAGPINDIPYVCSCKPHPNQEFQNTQLQGEGVGHAQILCLCATKIKMKMNARNNSADIMEPKTPLHMLHN